MKNNNNNKENVIYNDSLYLKDKLMISLIFGSDLLDITNEQFNIKRFNLIVDDYINNKRVDNEMKNNIMNVYIKYNNLLTNEELNENKRKINNSSSENLDEYLYYEYLKRTNKNYGNIDSKICNIIKESIVLDYSFLNSLYDNEFNEIFYTSISKILSNNIYFLFTINKILNEKPQFLTKEIREKIKTVLMINKKNIKQLNELNNANKYFSKINNKILLKIK